MPKHITTVYTINDIQAFEATRTQLFDQFRNSESLPFSITAISIDHEIQRLHWIEQAVENIDDAHALRSIIETILGHPDVGNITSLDQFE